MSENDTPTIRTIGGHLQRTIAQVLATVIVLVIFIGFAVLVYLERMPPGPLIFYSGVIVGYLSHVIAGRL